MSHNLSKLIFVKHAAMFAGRLQIIVSNLVWNGVEEAEICLWIIMTVVHPARGESGACGQTL